MKKLKLFYNPFSGNKSFKFDLDVCIGIFQEGGYEVHPFRTLHPGDIDTHIATMDPNYDIIVASGGDGTVNIVLNAMMHRGLHIPLGIIPSGTANDFATYLGFKNRCHFNQRLSFDSNKFKLPIRNGCFGGKVRKTTRPC